jgi:predicted GTPase
MGYYDQQVKDLEDTINAVPCDAVIIATPMDLRKVLQIKHPAVVATYTITDAEPPLLEHEVLKFVANMIL